MVQAGERIVDRGEVIDSHTYSTGYGYAIIEAAKKLLKTTNKSMKEIASEVGYPDPNYFSRNFKKYTGKTPTDYAKG